ncbi:hypothetical protein MP228_006633 [Amoeboaphelidium protococcarum]|nr:hypothetical protein MP228_006633 [Amoeboaphelidium protococcarum]
MRMMKLLAQQNFVVVLLLHVLVVDARQFNSRYHFQAPSNWLNDPCAPHYDNNTGKYHIYYQYSDYPSWKEPLLWRHATADSLIGPFADQGVVLSPSAPYDKESIFTGSGVALNVPMDLARQIMGNVSAMQDPQQQQQQLDQFKVAYYTGVTQFPLSWPLPYVPGTETQNLVWSTDGGYTWNKYEGNPILGQPPPAINVTGWRDPYIFQDDHIDTLLDGQLNEKKERYYMLIGSGIRGHGGAVIMYYSYDLVTWTVFKHPVYTRRHDNYGLDDGLRPFGYDKFSFGFNWEVPNLLPLGKWKDGEQLYLLSMGTEGFAYHLRGHHQQTYLVGTLRVAADTQQSSDFILGDSGGVSLEFVPISAGLLDHGMLYAVNSVRNVPLTSDNVVLGWINEDWEPSDMLKEGTSGLFGLPRKVTLIENTDGMPDVAVQPVKEVKQFRKSSSHVRVDDLLLIGGKESNNHHSSGLVQAPHVPPPLLPPDHTGEPGDGRNVGIWYYPLEGVRSSKFMEMRARLIVQGDLVKNDTMKIGFVIHHSKPFGPQLMHFDPGRAPEEQHPWGDYTIVYIEPVQRVLHVSRWRSSRIVTADNFGLNATIPYSHRDNSTFEVRIFVDNSALEIFVNDRVSLSTRIYPQYAPSLLGDFQNQYHHSVVSKIAPAAMQETYMGFMVSKDHKSDCKIIVDKADVWYDIGRRQDSYAVYSESGDFFLFGQHLDILCIVVVISVVFLGVVKTAEYGSRRMKV